MRKLLLTLATFSLAAVMLFSCGGKTETEETSSKKSDWRNSIEYEGFFYVTSTKKLLYSLDTGKITLWDNSSDGEILQTLEYDTSVGDATDRLEKTDINSDRYTDLRVIYSENGDEKTYNLWLWSEKEEQFVYCREYRNIVNPEKDEEQNIISTTDLGVFGKIFKKYTFTENLSLELTEYNAEDADTVAAKVAEAFGVEGVLMPGSGKATVDDRECTVYIATGTGTGGYICYNDSGEWFCDKGCIGSYRKAVDSDGVIAPGEYAGTQGKIISAVNMSTEHKDELIIVSQNKCTLNGDDAVKYTLSDEGQTFTAEAVECAGGAWYYSENGTDWYKLIANSEALGEKMPVTFANTEDTTLKDN